MSDYKALYRKWRPFDFDDVCGQRAITDILKYEVANGRVSHAYLFCGSRGTGKTSCAKILAKAVNCLNTKDGNPCNECEACRSIDAGVATDVIEMDAASNNGVGDVRSLKDEITFTPAVLKYRVYIIDEVHMMSGAAFNALLKTLEEPPLYVVFILATTEYNKLPTTIVSRCQRFDFRRMSSEVIIDRLKKISVAEKIDLGDDGARLIARASRGGMRDAVSLLELCAGSRAHIDANLVASTIGTGDRAAVYKLIEAVGAADFGTVYSVVRDVVMGSGDISVFWQEIIDSYRDIMVVKNTDKAKQYLDLTDVEYEMLKRIADNFTMAKLSYHTSLLESAMADMQRAVNSKRSIAEIALTRMCDSKLVVSAESLAVRVEELEKQIAMIKLGVPTEKPVQVKPSNSNKTPLESEPEGEACSGNLSLSVYDRWKSVVERIGELKRSLSSQFGGAEAYRSSDGKFYIRMSEFFASRISSNASDFAILRGVIAECEGVEPGKIEIVIEGMQKQNTQTPSNDLDNIFA
ncbi:MAG: DNA polymerase III subunit gamma/tau [Ruminococcaceae bacterium]|nr:DNA polymerase III subunit gamma/tau [Oscillospiraceae bacterium]